MVRWLKWVAVATVAFLALILAVGVVAPNTGALVYGPNGLLWAAGASLVLALVAVPFRKPHRTDAPPRRPEAAKPRKTAAASGPTPVALVAPQKYAAPAVRGPTLRTPPIKAPEPVPAPARPRGDDDKTVFATPLPLTDPSDCPPEEPSPASSGETVILAFLTLTPRRPDLPETVRIRAEALAALTAALRKTLGHPEARMAVIFPDEWRAPPLMKPADAGPGGAQEAAVRDAIGATIRQEFGGGEGVPERFFAAGPVGLENPQIGLIAIAAAVDLDPSRLGRLGQRLADRPFPPEAHYSRQHEAVAPPDPAPPSRPPAPAAASTACDICGTETEPAGLYAVRAETMGRFADRGYLPTKLGAKQREGAGTRDDLRAQWRSRVAAHARDWRICRPCAEEMDRFARGG